MSTADPSVRTSRVFEATVAVFDRLAELSFPPHPTIPNSNVELHLFRDVADSAEYVVVETNDDPAVNEWAQSSPAGADELIVVDVRIVTMYPQTDQSDPNLAARRVIVRLGQLADVVQSITYDTSAGKPKKVGFSNEKTTGRRESVSFRLAHTHEGVVGESTVRFVLAARI